MPTPGKFRTTTRQRIIELLRAGASRARAARAVGIHPSTLSRWIERGRTAHPEGRWRAFHDAVLEAETDPGLRAVRDEYRRIETDPDAAMRFLQARGELEPPPAEPLELQVTFVQSADVTTRPKGDPWTPTSC